MDLWIRSQDRTKIVKAPSIEIERVYKEETRKDTFYLCVDSSFWVGQYNTEERALEVIDEIQELLTTRICFENYNSFNLIYEMPKE